MTAYEIHGRERFFYWSVAVLCPLGPAAVMLVLLYRLGPWGSCEAELNNGAMTAVWLGAVGLTAVVAYPLFLIGAQHVLPKERREQLAQRLVVPVALGAATVTFLLGLIPILTYTTCVD